MTMHHFGWLLAVWLALAAGGITLARSAPPVQSAKGTVQTAFTPDGDIRGLLADATDQACERVPAQTYLLSNETITCTLLAVHQRDVDVRVLVNRGQMTHSGGSHIPEVINAGVPVWLEVRYKNAHNEVIVINPRGAHPMLVAGSFNFTQTTQRGSAGNVLIVRGDTNLAQRYAANWQKHAGSALSYRTQ